MKHRVSPYEHAGIQPVMNSGQAPRREKPRTAAPEAPVELELPNDATAPATARATTRETLTRWHLSQLLDPVLLAVSELVTNAFRHGRPPAHLLLARDRSDLTVDVHDASPRPPSSHPDTSAEPAESGRGLTIVTAVADHVEIQQIPDDGKTVQARFHADPHRASTCTGQDG